MQFTNLLLAPSVVRAVEERGYSEPTPVQAQAIPHILAGRDLKAIAQTGTGKTAAFALPLISILSGGRTRARMPRCLVLCPTRELAMQVADCFDAYSKHERLRMATLIGGVSFDRQLGILERGADVLIATPGRLLDHFERGRLLLTGASLVVVDEADRMLDIGFIPDLERIFRLLPSNRQSLLFSATMPPEIEKLARDFLSDPAKVEVAPPATTVDKVEQMLVRLLDEGDRTRLNALAQVVREQDRSIENAIVFCNRKRTVGGVVRFLQRFGFSVAGLHGDLDQHLRIRTLEGFRSGKVRILVASDVAARGLDIPSVSHVINFDVPLTSDDYVHRIGRTARAGRSGLAITLASGSESRQLDRVSQILDSPIQEYRLAAGDGRGGAFDGRDSRRPAPNRSRPRGHRPRNPESQGPSARHPDSRPPRSRQPGSRESSARYGRDHRVESHDRAASEADAGQPRSRHPGSRRSGSHRTESRERVSREATAGQPDSRESRARHNRDHRAESRDRASSEAGNGQPDSRQPSSRESRPRRNRNRRPEPRERAPREADAGQSRSRRSSDTAPSQPRRRPRRREWPPDTGPIREPSWID